MIDLDDLSSITRLDSLDVLSSVEAFPEHCHHAWKLGTQVPDLPDATGIESIAVLGMGGSGSAGDVAQAIVEPRLPIPFRVFKSYGPLPEWIGRNTLVVAVSYSGETEEVLTVLDEAHTLGTRTVTISSGGRLAELAVEYGSAHLSVPTGLPQPRAALAYLAMPLLSVLASMEVVPDLSEDVDETVAVVGDIAERCQRKQPLEDNVAKQIATLLAGKVPIVYGAAGLGATAAYRFKCDINEYAKEPAFAAELPEANHNEIVGWNVLDDLTRRHFAAVMIRDVDEDPRIARRFNATTELMHGHFASVTDVVASGTSEMARLFSLLLIGQMAAIYTGLANEVDPGPVEAIAKLKLELREREEGAI
ncbi:MAG: bifunctional phosphoglucose/phosphomannose isomerase [Actinomycetota bacterium]